LRRLGHHREAALAYRAALDLTDNETERAFLSNRLAGLTGCGLSREEFGDVVDSVVVRSS
jgi:hypothetical protein